MPTISVQGVMQSIHNHEFEPMSARQAQRLVKAASLALGGITLYLERHPATSAQLEQGADFLEFEDVYVAYEDGCQLLTA
ncbi:hypothetical protein D9M71_777110 [compost metagenome]